MKLQITYSELSFLREIVREKKLSIWKKVMVKSKFDNASPEEINEACDKYFNYHHGIPITDEGCINSLLKKFDKLESEGREILRMKTKEEKTDEKEVKK